MYSIKRSVRRRLKQTPSPSGPSVALQSLETLGSRHCNVITILISAI